MGEKDDTYRTISFKDYTFMINLAKCFRAGVRKRPLKWIEAS